jgi:hypothetical protein
VTCGNTVVDQTNLQNALNAGGLVSVAPGTCQITGLSMIVPDTRLIGSGRDVTNIQISTATGNAITMGNTSGVSPRGLEIQNLSINSSVTRTAGAAIYKYGTDRALINNININQMANGIIIDGGGCTSGNCDYNTYILNSYIENSIGFGVQLGVYHSGTYAANFPQNVSLQDLDISCNSAKVTCTGSTGIYVYNVGGLGLTNVGGTGNGVGMQMQPGPNQFASVNAFGGGWDSSNSYGLLIQPEASGLVGESYFVGYWASSSINSGGIGIAGAGVVSGLSFVQLKAVNNAYQGVYMNNGTYINFTGPIISGNNRLNSAGIDGMDIASGPSHITINGGTIGGGLQYSPPTSIPQYQKYAIGVSNNAYLLIEGVNTQGNVNSSPSGCPAASYGNFGAILCNATPPSPYQIGGNL